MPALLSDIQGPPLEAKLMNGLREGCATFAFGCEVPVIIPQSPQVGCQAQGDWSLHQGHRVGQQQSLN